MEIELTSRGPSRKRFIVLVLYACLVFSPIFGLVLYSTRDGYEYVNLVFNVNPSLVDRIEIVSDASGNKYTISGEIEKKIYFEQVSDALCTDILPRRGNEYIVTYHVDESEISYKLRESEGKYWMLLSSNIDGGFFYGSFLIKNKDFRVNYY